MQASPRWCSTPMVHEEVQLKRIRILLDLAASRPAAALTEVTRMLDREIDPAVVAQALRARALAYANLSEIHRASEAIEEASRVAATIDHPQVQAEIHMTRAGILGWAGDTAGALGAIEGAVAGLEGVAQARALVQRGTILYRAGRLTDALSDFVAAEPRLVEDPSWRARLLTNWALVIAYGGNLPGAEAKLLEARRLYEENGMESAAAETAQNLGWVAVRGGDLPRAFTYFDEAETVFEALGYGMGESWRDRSEALLAAHLTSDAKSLALRAVAELQKGGLAAALPEAYMRVARAAILDGDGATALQAATAAEQGFADQGRPAWRTLASYLILQARFDLDDLSVEDASTIQEVALALDIAGFYHGSQNALILAGKVAIAAGELDAARGHLRRVAQTRTRGPVDLRIQAWVATSLLRLASGDKRGADAAARAGLRMLGVYRDALSATDVRASVSQYGVELATIGTELALESRRPRRVFRWMEQTRAAALRYPPARPPDDAALAKDLMQLREVEAELRESQLAERDVDALWERRTTIQDAIRNRSRRVGGGTTKALAVPDVGEILDKLDGRVLVEYGRIRDRIFAVVLGDRRARLVDLGDSSLIRREIDALTAAARRVNRPDLSQASGAAAMDLLRHSRSELGALLVAPLRIETADVVVVPSRALYGVPWSALDVLEDSIVAVTPSAALWLRSATRHALTPGIGSVVVASGPRLEHAAAEVAAVAMQYPKATRLFEPSAEELSAAMDGAGVAHVACHGTLRVDNPLFSSLEVGDGPLTVYDLERLDAVPNVIVLSACDAGMNPTQAGDEIVGLTASLLRMGASAVVANLGLVPDTPDTIGLMKRFHLSLAAGVPAPEALARALRGSSGNDAGALAARSFVVFTG